MGETKVLPAKMWEQPEQAVRKKHLLMIEAVEVVDGPDALGDNFHSLHDLELALDTNTVYCLNLDVEH